MLRKNFMNGLMALAAVGAVLTGYNAFVKDSVDGRTATQQVAEYLALDATEQEPVEGTTNVAVDTTQNDATVSVDQGSATSENSTDATQSPDAMPADDTSMEETSEDDAMKEADDSTDKSASVYTVKDGDTYGCIAEKYYGSFEHWVDVMNANPTGQVGFSEYGLHVDAKLTLPAIAAANLKPTSNLCN